MGVRDLWAKTADEILGCPEADIDRFLPYYQHGCIPPPPSPTRVASSPRVSVSHPTPIRGLLSLHTRNKILVHFSLSLSLSLSVCVSFSYFFNCLAAHTLLANIYIYLDSIGQQIIVWMDVFRFDKLGRPVFYEHFGKCEIEKLLEQTTLEKYVLYHIWKAERAVRLCINQSLKSGYVVETFCLVLDLDKMSMRQISRSFMSVIQSISAVDQNHYPERMGELYIINAPRLFPYVFNGTPPPQVHQEYLVRGIYMGNESQLMCTTYATQRIRTQICRSFLT
jgi:hypothetical protein